MKQDIFPGSASGRLLADTVLSDWLVFPDRADGPVGHLALSRCGGWPAHNRWVAILAHLDHVIAQCGQPDMVRQLKAFGVKRTRTVVVELSNEYIKACDMAASTGLTPTSLEVLLASQAMQSYEVLADEFHALADAYLKLLEVLIPNDCVRLLRWITNRASVHDARALNLQGALRGASLENQK